MKHKRLVAGVLSLALACTILSPLQLAFAETSESGSDGGDSSSETEGLEISKTAVANDDGTYTIKLEAYATGSSITSIVSKDVPTDIVLVLDQSGSMADPIGTVSFQAYNRTQNSYYYARRHNGGDANLYYSLGDGTYAAVSVNIEEQVSIRGKLSSLRNSALYKEYQNSLYALVDGKYQKITVKREYNYYYDDYDYYYTLNGDTILQDDSPSTGKNTRPTFKYEIYNGSVDDTKTIYTYTYVDASGVTRTIGTSTGADTSFADATLYRRVVNENDGGSRLNALKKAVTTFANSVAEKAKGADGLYNTEDDVDHRIAVVGFASGNPSNTLYLNSEVFVGAQQYQYNTTASQHYSDALQSMNKEEGRNNIAASIGALASNGATYTNLGIEMANGILGANPLQENEKRNRVVVVFTDGIPGRTGWDEDVANNAIAQAYITKSEYKATVYTVGIFSGADATSAGNENGNETQKANWFMQNLSSNNGTPRTPSYYLSAADADTLKNIFKQISNQIESGGSSITLGSEAVVKDIISPYFTLPENANESDITVTSWDCSGVDSGNYTWNNDTTLYDMATVKNGQVSVTGFDFAGNWVGTETAADGTKTYRGKKLVISFTVEPKAGFLGGNDVPTNGAQSGIYANGTDTTALENFTQPTVNVPIDDVTVTAKEKNVYLYGSVTAKELKEGAVVTCGDVNIDLSKAVVNYGLKEWQNQYVNIQVEIIDSAGETISSETDGTAGTVGSLSNLTEDGDYTIKVTVSPKTSSTEASGSGTPADSQEGSGKADINVFKPVLTFKDSEVYYGDAVPTDYFDNLVSTVWKNGDISSTDTGVSMIGTAPTVDGVEGAAEVNVMPKSNLAVEITKVTLKDSDNQTHVIAINSPTDMVGFVHQKCNQGEEGPSNGQFWLHPLTCQLTVAKSRGNSNESYTFDIERNGQKYSEVTIWGNGFQTIYELPVGSYTITESTGDNTGWSWRFGKETSTTVELKANDAEKEGTIVCTNNEDPSKTKWLNGYSSVVRNIYGQKHTSN